MIFSARKYFFANEFSAEKIFGRIYPPYLPPDVAGIGHIYPGYAIFPALIWTELRDTE